MGLLYLFINTLSHNLGALTSCNSLGLSRSVMGLLYLYLLRLTKSVTFLSIKRLSCRVPEHGGSYGMCRLMQALYAVYRKTECRHEGHDTRRRSNLNDICTCRGTESTQTLFPNCIIAPSYIESILWHVNHSPCQNTTPSCLQDATFHASSYMCSSLWIEMHCGEAGKQEHRLV